MRRLGFSLPDFCRVSWTSEGARLNWQEKIERSAAFWKDIELETVLLGQRSAGIVAVTESSLQQISERCERCGMSLKPLYSLAPRSRYVSSLTAQHRGSSLEMCAVGRESAVTKVEKCFALNQSADLGALLGYPRCCVAFFQQVWEDNHFKDTSWFMAAGGRTVEGRGDAVDRTIDVAAPPELNLLTRWLGIRPVFHLPCSFSCRASFEIAQEIVSVAEKIGRHEEMKAIYEVLRWPVQWSALHGIAEIETPVLRISTTTDATAQKYTVRFAGDPSSVSDAARGNRFPYVQRASQKERVLRSPSRPRLEDEYEQWLYVDNGFRSRADMERAFATVVSRLLERAPKSVFHVGCRNGAMLRFAIDNQPSLTVAGIDQDEARIKRAHRLLPAHAERLRIGRLDDTDLPSMLDRTDVYLVMAGRLLELEEPTAIRLLEQMRRRSNNVLLYAFDDWLRNNSMEAVAALVGSKLSDGRAEPSVAGARWLCNS